VVFAGAKLRDPTDLYRHNVVLGPHRTAMRNAPVVHPPFVI
jgi:hypothetical protein